MFVTEKAHNAVFMDQFHQIYTMYIYIYIHSEAPNLHFIVQL